MPGPDAIWFLAIFFEIGVVVCALTRKSFQRYFTLNLYMAASALVGILRYATLSRYGLQSPQYFYGYYYSDALLTVCLYFSLIGLYAMVFEELGAERQVRWGAALLLAGTALFSYSVVRQSDSRLLTHYVVVLSQNLYFVGVVLTYVLWGAILKLRETRARLVQMVLSLGIYFSAFAATYALRNLYPNMHVVWGYLPPMMAFLLPLAWVYTFIRIPEDARLAPSRLVAISR